MPKKKTFTFPPVEKMGQRVLSIEVGYLCRAGVCGAVEGKGDSGRLLQRVGVGMCRESRSVR